MEGFVSQALTRPWLRNCNMKQIAYFRRTSFLNYRKKWKFLCPADWPIVFHCLQAHTRPVDRTSSSKWQFKSQGSIMHWTGKCSSSDLWPVCRLLRTIYRREHRAEIWRGRVIHGLWLPIYGPILSVWESVGCHTECVFRKAVWSNICYWSHASETHLHAMESVK
jgi:hypothetical protein